MSASGWGNVYKNMAIGVYFDGEQVQHRRRQVMAPGEMETVILKTSLLTDHPEADGITVTLEEA